MTRPAISARSRVPTASTRTAAPGAPTSASGTAAAFRASSEHDAEKLETCRGGRANLRRSFPDAPRERQHVHAPIPAAIEAIAALSTVCVDGQRERHGRCRAPAAGATAQEPKQPGVVLEANLELSGRDATFAQQPEEQARIHGSRSGGHHGALERRESHRRVDRATVVDGRQRRAGARGGRRRPPTSTSRAGRREHGRSPWKRQRRRPWRLDPGRGEGVRRRGGRQAGVEGGVEGDGRQAGASGADRRSAASARSDPAERASRRAPMRALTSASTRTGAQYHGPPWTTR